MKRHALFVGINNYKQGIQPLSCAKRDADELRLLFARAGFETDIMTNEEASGGEAIRKRVKKLTSGLGPGDLFLFYFSGHGVYVSGRQLLVGTDASCDDCNDWVSSGGRGRSVPLGAVALDDIASDTNKSFERVFLLDMCRAALPDGQKGIAPGLAVRDLSMSNPGVGRMANFTYLYSCDEGQSALEIREAGRGLFSLAFSSLFTDRMSNQRRLLLDSEFVGAMENEMRNVAQKYGLDSCGQRPHRDPHGDPIVLFDPAMLSDVHGAPMLAVCPLCGKKNKPKDTFKCRECGRDDICLDHRDKTRQICSDCADKKDSEKSKVWLETELRNPKFIDGKLCRNCQACLDGEHGKALQRLVLEICRAFSTGDAAGFSETAGQVAPRLLEAVCSSISDMERLQGQIKRLENNLLETSASAAAPANVAIVAAAVAAGRPLSHEEHVQIKDVLRAVDRAWRERAEIKMASKRLVEARSDVEAIEAIRAMESEIHKCFEGRNDDCRPLVRLNPFFIDRPIVTSFNPTNVQKALRSLFSTAGIYCAGSGL